jgi:hypothetical protein
MHSGALCCSPSPSDFSPHRFDEARTLRLAMLPGMKHRIKIWPTNRSGQTMVYPTRFGSVIKASSATSIQVIFKANPIVAVLRFPINIADSKAVRERTT